MREADPPPVKGNLFQDDAAAMPRSLLERAKLDLNYWYQKDSWQRDKHFELLRYKITEGFSLIDGLGILINDRFFGLQRVIWALGYQKPPLFQAMTGAFWSFLSALRSVKRENQEYCRLSVQKDKGFSENK